MRSLIISALSLVVFLPAFGGTAASAGPSSPKDPRAFLDSAEPFYNYSSPELKPWHLKATYQLYDEKGAPAGQGTWEYWWASPKVHHSSWTRAAGDRSDWWTEQGALYRMQNGSPLRYFERSIESILLSPLPAREAVDSGSLTLELKMFSSHEQKVACIIATSRRMVHGKWQAPISGTATDYFFDPPTMTLGTVFSDPLTTQYTKLVKMQGRYLPREVVVKRGDLIVFSLSVDTIGFLSPDDAVFSPPADATLEERTIEGRLSNPSVTEGLLMKKTPPIYPLVAKMNHEQGVVVLAATIGTDGNVHNLEVLASPSPLLAGSALDAVKKWKYKPYLLNGQPVQVDTIIRVIFSLGG